jgi:hypothetical protein
MGAAMTTKSVIALLLILVFVVFYPIVFACAWVAEGYRRLEDWTEEE